MIRGVVAVVSAAAQDLQAGDTWQHDVEDDHVR
jgi:hypothetical protein